MNSADVLSLLRQRHANDLFVPECKNGPTWGGTHLRLDAWVMSRSWTHFQTFGYEIKMSRSDFLNDTKLQFYLPLCNMFFLVCAPGVVKSVEEVPEDAGLLVVASTGTMLLTKKKAKFRDIADPVNLYRYVLMCRSEIVQDAYHPREDEEVFWSRWLKDKQLSYELGRRVSKALSQTLKEKVLEVREEIDAMKRESERVQEENKRLQCVKDALKEMGIDPHLVRYYPLHDLLERAKKGFPTEVQNALAGVRKNVQCLSFVLDEMESLLQDPEGRKDERQGEADSSFRVL